MSAISAQIDVGPRRSRVSSHHICAVILYAFFGVFLIWPIVQIVAVGFVEKGHGLSLVYLKMIFADAQFRAGMGNAVMVAVAVTTCTLLVSLPLAVLNVRYEFRGRRLLSGLLLAPLVLPPFVGAIGMRLVLGRFGTLTQIASWFFHLFGGQGFNGLGIDFLGHHKLAGVIVIEVLHLYPIMLLNLQAALANIDPAMDQAAANLGAGRWRRFRRITLPLLRPGLFAGCTLVLIWSFTELGTPLMFDFYTITPVQIFHQITEVADNPLPYALVVVMLAGSAGLYVVGKLILGRGFDAATTKGSAASAAKRLTRWLAAAALAPGAAIFFLAILPHLAVILTSVSSVGAWYKSVLPTHFTAAHFASALSDDLAVSSIKWSIIYAACATALAVAMGLATAIVVVRGKIRGSGVLDALAMLPLAVPGIVLAFGYLAISVFFKQRFSCTDWLSALNVAEFPVVAIVVAYAARRLPYVFRAAAAGLEQTPRELELAAHNLGARKMTVLRRITIPLILANLAAGALLAFAFSMLEVSDSLILAQRREFFPITKAIYELSQRLGDGVYVASALGVWAMVFLTLTILCVNRLVGRKMGQIFRV